MVQQLCCRRPSSLHNHCRGGGANRWKAKDAERGFPTPWNFEKQPGKRVAPKGPCSVSSYAVLLRNFSTSVCLLSTGSREAVVNARSDIAAVNLSALPHANHLRSGQAASVRKSQEPVLGAGHRPSESVAGGLGWTSGSVAAGAGIRAVTRETIFRPTHLSSSSKCQKVHPSHFVLRCSPLPANFKMPHHANLGDSTPQRAVRLPLSGFVQFPP